MAVDVIDFMNALRIEKAVLAGFDWGGRTACIGAALWPERVRYLIGNQEAGKMPLPPKAEFEWWYQFYFATERGRIGYEKNRHDFNKLIWRQTSPKWNFDDATYARSAAAFDVGFSHFAEEGYTPAELLRQSGVKQTFTARTSVASGARRALPEGGAPCS